MRKPTLAGDAGVESVGAIGRHLRSGIRAAGRPVLGCGAVEWVVRRPRCLAAPDSSPAITTPLGTPALGVAGGKGRDLSVFQAGTLSTRQYGSRPPRGKIISNRPGLASCRSLTRSPGGYVGEAGTAVSQATVVAEPGPRSPRFLSSKFRAPKLVPQLVRRSRLLDQLDRGEQVRLALLVGPAGAGKTMLLADWLAARPERPSAWLSCDAADADPARFVAAIVEPARHGFGQPQLVPAS